VEFEQQLEAERIQATHPGRRELVDPVHSEPPASGLYIDDGNHVWIDGQLLTGGPSGQEFRLVKELYDVAPAIVSQDDLIAAVWNSDYTGTDDELRDSDEQNLRKLVDRLRQRLEPEAKRGTWRFVQNARGRGYWLNTR
jgi:DNA-binding response OmpR family regulator